MAASVDQETGEPSAQPLTAAGLGDLGALLLLLEPAELTLPLLKGSSGLFPAVAGWARSGSPGYGDTELASSEPIFSNITSFNRIEQRTSSPSPVADVLPTKRVASAHHHALLIDLELANALVV